MIWQQKLFLCLMQYFVKSFMKRYFNSFSASDFCHSDETESNQFGKLIYLQFDKLSAALKDLSIRSC